MKNEAECIREINSLLSVPNEKLATDIYNLYRDKVEVKLSVEEAIIYEMKKDITEDVYDKMCDVFAIDDINVFSSSDICSTEAITTYAKYNTVDTTISMEVLEDDINSVHKTNCNLRSPKNLMYYADSNNKIENIPDHYICLIAIEHMISGCLEGMTGAEHFTYEALNYDISEDLMHKFKYAFYNEDKYMGDSGARLVLAATEKFFARDAKVGEKVASCPQLDIEAFKKVMREGDVIVVYRKSSGLPAKAFSKVNSWVTGSSFSSIKIIGPGGKSVIGYGAKVGVGNAREVPMDYFLDTCKGAICIRYIGMTPNKAKEIIEHARSIEQKNTGYDYKAIVKTMFTHRKEEKNGPVKLLNKEEAKNYYAPMICTTLVTSSFRAAGLDPGISISDRIAWPVDVLKSNKFKPIASWFMEGIGPNMRSKKDNSSEKAKKAQEQALAENKQKLEEHSRHQAANKETIQKADAMQHELMQETIAKEKEEGNESAESLLDEAFTEFYIASTEEFFSKDARVREVVRRVRKVSLEEFQSIAREGDAVTVTRTGEGNWKTWMNKHVVQKQSFTSLKMIGPGCKTVIGFGVKIGQNGGGKIDEISYEDFSRTCKAMVLCRPKNATADQLHTAYMFMRTQQGRNIPYMSVAKNLLSVARHAFNFKAGKISKTPMSKEEIENYRGSLLCSSVVANAWRYAGIDNGFHSTSEIDVWPKDFLINDALEYPAAYFASGELPNSYLTNAYFASGELHNSYLTNFN